MSTAADFQRARRPEQVAARREAILRAAHDLLAQRPGPADISLGAIGEKTGMAKSALLRYFESREAIFLEILDQQWREWLDALEQSRPAPDGGPWAVQRALSATVADSLAERPTLCALMSVMAGVLERNIGVEFARDFKRRVAANTDRLARLVSTALPDLPDTCAQQFAGAAVIVTAGLWPYAHPTEAVATVSAEMGVPDPAAAFHANLRAGLAAQLIGLSAESAAA